MSNLNYRIITAILLILITIPSIFFLSLKILSYVTMFICILAAWEWSKLIGWNNTNMRIIYSILFSIIILNLQFLLKNKTELIKEPIIIYILSIGLIWWLIAIILVITFPISVHLWSKSILLKSLFGIFIIIPFYLGILMLKSICYKTNPFIGSWIILYVMILVWSTDIGGYIFGYLFGKHKLLIKISPNKTIEGGFGGILTASIINLIFNYFVFIPIIFKHLILYSIIIIFISIFGDLTESMFKRNIGIKNSSNLIPGHGGILDRIDSLMAAISFFAGLIILF